MRNLLGEYVSEERRRQRLSYGDVARRIGYRNVGKGARRIADFEREGIAPDDLAAKIVEVLGLDPVRARELAEADYRDRQVEEKRQRALLPADPYGGRHPTSFFEAMSFWGKARREEWEKQLGSSSILDLVLEGREAREIPLTRAWMGIEAGKGALLLSVFSFCDPYTGRVAAYAEIQSTQRFWITLEAKGITPFLLLGRWESVGEDALNEFVFLISGDGQAGRLERVARLSGHDHLLIRPGSDSAIQIVGGGEENPGAFSPEEASALWTRARNGLDQGLKFCFHDTAWVSNREIAL